MKVQNSLHGCSFPEIDNEAEQKSRFRRRLLFLSPLLLPCYSEVSVTARKTYGASPLVSAPVILVLEDLSIVISPLTAPTRTQFTLHALFS